MQIAFLLLELFCYSLISSKLPYSGQSFRIFTTIITGKTAMHPVVNIAITAARNASQIISRSMEHLESVNITEKQRNDLVTEIDRLAEKEIINTLRKAYPNHGILAEESGLSTGDDENLWVIDALDSTLNFSHSLPHFCISIALIHKGKIQHAVIFDPLRQELFTASRGEGARLNDRRIRVSQCKRIEDALLGTCFPRPLHSHSECAHNALTLIIKQAINVRSSGSAALDLAYVAAGRLDGFWEFGTQDWDIAAGALLVKEAGGLVTNVNGEEKYLETGNIIAGNSKVLKGLLQALEALS